MIIRVHYFSEVCVDFVYKDIDIGPTCFCESRAEVIGYAFNRAVAYCNEHNVEFNGFEIIAE